MKFKGPKLGLDCGLGLKYRDSSAVTSAKIAEPIVMQFGLWAPSGSRNDEIDGGPDPPREGAILGERVV